MFSRWISLNGVSLTASINFRFSLIETSAARDMRSSQYPDRIAARVFMLQGSTAMPSWMKDPLAMGADISFACPLAHDEMSLYTEITQHFQHMDRK
ncbi:unnamed protein product [Clonostachys byssicola]|uniref:Uncharacterized protein n=1 Tax=Clonostachys byssicola TaxID=160290 RepID=A0A9N9Y0V5_9HYPO|nr:unnamed protein product [Clonostachys byssicola]